MRHALVWPLLLVLGACSGPEPDDGPVLHRLFAQSKWVSAGMSSDLRRAFPVRVASRSVETLLLPSNGRLDWEFAARYVGKRRQLETRVLLRGQDGETVLDVSRFLPEHKGVRHWRSRQVDLSPWGGQSVELVFEARYVGESPTSDDDRVRVLWSSPRIVATSSTETRPTSVILILVDTLRADRLGCYGDSRPITPAIDSLAARGVLFESAFSQANWTLPSVTSLVSGLYPSRHGVLLGQHRAPPDDRSLAPLMARNGYLTAGFHAGGYLSRQYGFDHGFDDYRQWSGFSEVSRAVSWLEEHRATPFLLFLHTYDVHAPYGSVPEPYWRTFLEEGQVVSDELLRSKPNQIDRRDSKGHFSEADVRVLSDLYDGEIRFVDEQLGWFFGELTRLGLDEEVLIILTSDHGEEFGEHGGMEHGTLSLHREVVNVPLIVSGPGIPRGLRLDQPVQLIDLLPTLAALLDLQGLDARQLDGSSFASFLGITGAGGGEPPSRAISQHGERWAIRSPRWAAMGSRDGSAQLFDRRADPGERQNVAETNADVFESEFGVMRELTRNGQENPVVEVEIDEELERELRALGYVD